MGLNFRCFGDVCDIQQKLAAYFAAQARFEQIPNIGLAELVHVVVPRMIDCLFPLGPDT